MLCLLCALITLLTLVFNCMTYLLFLLLLCFQSGITPLVQHQFEELAKQKLGDSSNSGKKSKLVVIGQNCVEPLQALRSSGHEVYVEP